MESLRRDAWSYKVRLESCSPSSCIDIQRSTYLIITHCSLVISISYTETRPPHLLHPEFNTNAHLLTSSMPQLNSAEIHLHGSTFSVVLSSPLAHLSAFQTLLELAVCAFGECSRLGPVHLATPPM